VQVSGADQWGNIVAGIDLIRRKEGKTAYALTIPLIIDKATGKKFGKSEDNAVWLDRMMTSSFRFYQFWLNASDESVEDYLKIFTMLSLEEINTTMVEHRTNPSMRTAQKNLALEVTKFVHNDLNADNARKTTAALFGGEEITYRVACTLRNEAPTHNVAVGADIIDVLVESGLASSKREARLFIDDGAVTLNNEKIDISRTLVVFDFTYKTAILRRGKRHVVVLTLQ
jgi:tyrosyl-tRNA synthetase